VDFWHALLEHLYVRRVSGVWLVRLGWIPCLSSDVQTRMPSQLLGRPKLSLLEVGFLCCLTNAQALLCTIGCLSPLARRVRAKPKADLVSHVFLTSSWSMSSSSDPWIR
ncbi:hypothetical protein HAX54_008233, partial [Datura stramonium]|nr:hypothetical protein [Datura stramonium]